jgi:hypothetical protein
MKADALSSVPKKKLTVPPTIALDQAFSGFTVVSALLQ